VGAVALSVHVTVDGASWAEAAPQQAGLKAVLRDRFHIEHTTIQLECVRCAQGTLNHANGVKGVGRTMDRS
jgi:Co/Zn/Cd efflux system component